MSQKKAKAVLISDVHVSVKNFEPSIAALKFARDAANELDVPLVSGGDIHDTKSIHNSKCIRAMRKVLRNANLQPRFTVGNHERENEKATDHALECVEDLVIIFNEQKAHYDKQLDLWFVPYCHEPEVFLAAIEAIPDGADVICHQGVKGARMGEYIVDRSSVDPSVFERFRSVHSGHYHEHQIIGKFQYIGSPYTITAAEANDGPKGVRILFDDGSSELIELDQLRRHVTLEVTVEELKKLKPFRPDTILKLKVTGSSEDLAAINKLKLGEKLLGHANLKLDRIATDSPELHVLKATKSETFTDVMGSMVSTGSDSVKNLWKELNEAS
jgi:hypothetical protein